LNYRFSKVQPSHREAADPTMVVHNGTYWLFASKSGGYWHSTDMNNWEFVTPTGLPIEDYAPMVVVLGDGRFYYTAFGSSAMYSTSDPYAGNWSKVAGMNHYSDPGMLVDSDGKVYMYSGCKDDGNIKAVELDNATWKEIGSPVDAVTPDYTRRGFEVGGDNNELLSDTPWVEGAFMNKIGNKYYLQYAVPGLLNTTPGS
jgi:beta-xylosidase